MHFNRRLILRTISIVLIILGVAMLLPIFCAVYYDELDSAKAFFFSLVCCFGIGSLGIRFSNYRTVRIKYAESYFIAIVCWATVSIVGTMPYILSDCGYSLADSIFESISGWTTTGAWVIPFDTLPVSIVLWKAITNWLGGMGLLLLALTFFPILGAEGQKMANAEMPGTKFEKLSSRTSQTAVISYIIYIIMTLLEFCLLLPTKLNVVEALCNTLSSISTAGLYNVNGCIDLHMNAYIKIVLALFSIIGSVNFVLYYYICSGNIKKALRSTELKTFLGLITFGTVITAISLLQHGMYTSIPETIVDSFTQTVAYSATSGFEIADINAWPTISKVVLMTLMIAGGCGNSTSGSVKIIRVVIFYKIIARGVFKRIHPNAVKPIMLDGAPVSTHVASNVTVFIMLYFAVFVFSNLVLSLENLDMETTFFATLACMTNNGTGFGKISGGDFSILSGLGRCYAALLMLAGRLEFYSIIMLFSPSFWNSDRARS